MLTIVREMLCDANEAAIEYAISGWPSSGAMFFPGMPFEPARAGIMAIVLMAGSGHHTHLCMDVSSQVGG